MMVSHAERAAPAARVGADLRAARERLGWSLPAIAAHLRIREAYLAALEDGRIDDLPGVAYAVGFLRSYAAVLGLDPAEMIRRFRVEAAAAANRRPELNFPAPVPDRGVPAGAVVLLGAVLAVGAYIGWYRASEHAAPQSDAVPAVPARLAALAEKDAPPLPAPVPAPDPPAIIATAAPEPAPPPLPSISPSSAAAAVVIPPLAPPAPQVPMPPEAAPVTAPPTPSAEAPAGPPHIVVRATADAWVQVRDKGGQVLLNRVLRGGESWEVPDRPALLLTTGNAGGTELLVDGIVTAALGNDGAVRRDLPLDAEAIRSGRLAPHATPQH